MRDHLVTALWTAWHVHKWIWDAIREKPELKLTVLKYRGIETQTINPSEGCWPADSLLSKFAE